MIKRVRNTIKMKDVLLDVEFAANGESYVERGQKIKKGDKLFTTNYSVIVESHYLPKSLGIKAYQSRDHIGRVAGQYISKGDLIGERLTAGGLITKKVVAGTDGIVSTNRIDMGYLDIISESDEILVESKVNGVIEDITPSNSVTIKTDALVYKILGSRNTKSVANDKGRVVGELKVIGDGRSVYTRKDLASSYTGKVVYAGRFLYPDVARDLYKKECKAIITYAMDYEDFRDLGVPVVVLGGFDQLVDESEMYKDLLGSNEEVVQIDPNEKRLYIHGGSAVRKGLKTHLDGYQPLVKIGDIVRSLDVDTYGVVGEVKELTHDDDILIVQKNKGPQLLINRDSVEILV